LKLSLRWFGLLLLPLLFLSSSLSARAQSSNVVTLTVVPASLAFAPKEKLQVVVTAALPEEGVQFITLSKFHDAAVVVSIADARREGDLLRGAIAWTVEITRLPQGAATGTIHFRADYEIKGAQGGLVPGVVTTALAITERPQDQIDDILSARIDTALEQLNQGQSQQLFIVVTNKSNIPVTITDVSSRPPQYVNATIEAFDAGLVLAPQQTRPIGVTLTTDDLVQIGKHVIVFDVAARWERNGVETQGNLVLKQAFAVGVPLQSDLLTVLGFTALGIASLYFVPGFLIVTAFVFLYNQIKPKEPLDFGATKTGFWLIAVSLSLAAVFLYPVYSPYLFRILFLGQTTARNLFVAYGLNDIFALWAGSVAVGIALWGLWVFVGIPFHARARALDARLYVPTSEDDPRIILEKLVNHRAGYELERARYTQEDQTQNVLLLPSKMSASPDKRWIIPFAILDGAEETYKAQARGQLAAKANGRAFLKLFKQWGNNVTFEWELPAQNPVRGPQWVDRASAPASGGRDYLIRVKQV